LRTKSSGQYRLEVDSGRQARKAELELSTAEQLRLRGRTWPRKNGPSGHYFKRSEISTGRRTLVTTGCGFAARAWNEAGRTLFLLANTARRSAIHMAAGCVQKAGDKLEYADALGQVARLHSYLGNNLELKKVGESP